MDEVEIVGIADINPDAPGMEAARKDGIFVTTNYSELTMLPDVDIIIEVTGNQAVKNISRRTSTSVRHCWSQRPLI